MAYSEPPPLKPYFYGAGSSSTLTIELGNQPLSTSLPSPGEKFFPLPQNTISTASQITPQISSRTSDCSSSHISPVSYRAGTVMYENQETRRYCGSQATLYDPVPNPNYNGPGEQLGGQPNQQVGRVGWRPSRRDTATSEPASPLLPYPPPFNPNGPWGSQPNQVCRQMSGAGKSRESLRATPDDRHRSRKDVNAFDEGYNRGGSSLNPSRASSSSYPTPGTDNITNRSGSTGKHPSKACV